MSSVHDRGSGNTGYEHTDRNHHEILLIKDVLQSTVNERYFHTVQQDAIKTTGKQNSSCGGTIGGDTGPSSYKLSLDDEEYLCDDSECERVRNLQRQCDVEMLQQKITEDDASVTFNPGDLVWAKVKSHPWWPGQIFNAMDASKAAKMSQKSGRLLVAFFGDGTYGWLQKSQLIAFRSNFEDKVKQTTTKNFRRAISQALNEVCRRSELGMACSHYHGLTYSEVAFVDANAGIENGVKVIAHQDIHLSKGAFSPEKTLEFIRTTACYPSCPPNFSVEMAELCGHAFGIRAFLFRKALDNTFKRSFLSIKATDEAVNKRRKDLESPQLNKADSEKRRETKRPRVIEDVIPVHDYIEDDAKNNLVHVFRDKSQTWGKQENVISVGNVSNVQEMSNKETLIMKGKRHLHPQENGEKKRPRIQQQLESGDQQLENSENGDKFLIEGHAPNVMKGIKAQDATANVFLSGSMKRIKKQVKAWADPEEKLDMRKTAEGRIVKGSEHSTCIVALLEEGPPRHSPDQPHAVQKHGRIVEKENQTRPLSANGVLNLVKEKKFEGHSEESNNFSDKKTIANSASPELSSNYKEEFGEDDTELVELQKYPGRVPSSNQVKMGEKNAKSLKSSEAKLNTMEPVRKDRLKAQVGLVHKSKELNQKYHKTKVGLNNNEDGESRLTKAADSSTLEHFLGYLLQRLRVLARDPLKYARDQGAMQDAMNVFLRFRNLVFLKSLSYGTTRGQIRGIVDAKEIKRFLIQHGKSGKLTSTVIESSCEHNNVKAQPCFQDSIAESKNSEHNSLNGALELGNQNALKYAAFETQMHDLQQHNGYLVQDRGKMTISFPPQNLTSDCQVMGVAARKKKSEIDQTINGNSSSSLIGKNTIHVADSKAIEYPLALFIRFPQDFPIPPESQLLEVFSQFGPLETRLHRNSSSAQVVFKNNHDAEAALMHSLRKNLFGADASYKLCYFSQFQKLPTNHDTFTSKNENTLRNGTDLSSFCINPDPPSLHQQTQTQFLREQGLAYNGNAHVSGLDFVNSYTSFYPSDSYQIQDQTCRIQGVMKIGDVNFNATVPVSPWTSSDHPWLLYQQTQDQSQRDHELPKKYAHENNGIDFKMRSLISPGSPSGSFYQLIRAQSHKDHEHPKNRNENGRVNGIDFVNSYTSFYPSMSHQQTQDQTLRVEDLMKIGDVHFNATDSMSSWISSDNPWLLLHQQTQAQCQRDHELPKNCKVYENCGIVSSHVSPGPPSLYQLVQAQSHRDSELLKNEIENVHVNGICFVNPYTSSYPSMPNQQTQDQTLGVQGLTKIGDVHFNATNSMSSWISSAHPLLFSHRQTQAQNWMYHELSKNANIQENGIDFNMGSFISPGPPLLHQLLQAQSQKNGNENARVNGIAFISSSISPDPPLPHQQMQVQSPEVHGMVKNMDGFNFLGSCISPDPPLSASQGMGEKTNAHMSGIEAASSCISQDPSLPLSHQRTQRRRVKKRIKHINSHVNGINFASSGISSLHPPVANHQAFQSSSDTENLNINNNSVDLSSVTTVNVPFRDIQDQMMKLLHAVNYIVSSYSFDI